MKSWKVWTAVVLTVGFLGLLAFGLTRDVQKLPSALVGQPAPEFRAPTLDGDTLSSQELRGSVVVLNFWASWCVPCRQEHSVLVRTDRTWEEDEARVVGVVYQDSREAALRFMERLGGDWPSLQDPQSRVAIDFGVYGVPETYFLTPDGEVAKKHIGPLTWETVRGTVDSLLALSESGTASGDDPAAGSDEGTLETAGRPAGSDEPEDRAP